MRHLSSLIAIGVLVISGALDASAQATASKLGPPRAAPAARAQPGAGAAAAARSGRQLLPGTRPNVLISIQGDALNSTNGKIPDAAVRLRDARLGRIVDATTTDKSGAWAFHQIDPGSYVVELLGPDQTVWAATPIINVNAGESASAVLKLPFRTPRFGGLLGPSAPSAAAIASAAAASGVLAAAVTGEPVSPSR